MSYTDELPSGSRCQAEGAVRSWMEGGGAAKTIASMYIPLVDTLALAALCWELEAQARTDPLWCLVVMQHLCLPHYVAELSEEAWEWMPQRQEGSRIVPGGLPQPAARAGNIPRLRHFLATVPDPFRLTPATNVVSWLVQSAELEALQVLVEDPTFALRREALIPNFLWALAEAPDFNARDVAWYFRQHSYLLTAIQQAKRNFLGRSEFQFAVDAAAEKGNVAFFVFLADAGIADARHLSGRHCPVLDVLVRVGCTTGNLALLKYAQNMGYDNWGRRGGFVKLSVAHYAAERLHFHVIEFLSKLTDVVTPTDHKGMTPVDYLVREAARQGNVQLLQGLVLAYGFKAWTKPLNANGETALRIAEKQGRSGDHQQQLDALKRYVADQMLLS